MATVKCPSNVSSVTLAVSGAKTPDSSGLITGLTSLEANALCPGGPGLLGLRGAIKQVSGASNGDLTLSFPVAITGITINSVAYTVTGAATPWGKVLNAAVPAAAASIVLSQNFSLVVG